MDGVGTATLLGIDKILVQNALCGIFLFCGAVGEQAFLLVDDEEVFVLVDDVQPWTVEAFLSSGFADFHNHAWLKGEVELCGALPVDRDGFVGQHSFYLVSTDAIQFLHQEVHQLHGFRNVEFQRVAFGMRSSLFVFFHGSIGLKWIGLVRSD